MGISVSSGLSPVVIIDGDIDYSNSGDLKDTVQYLVDSGHNSIDLDMSAVEFIDSSGIRVLLQYAMTLPQSGGMLRLYSPTDMVNYTLSRLGVNSILGIPDYGTTNRAWESSASYTRQQGQTVSFAVPSEVRSPGIIRRRVDEIVAELEFSDRERADIKLAVGEAAANAVRHGSRSEGSTITVSCTVDEKRLTIEISDHGDGFNPGKVRPPDFARLPTGGMGLAIIRMIMDEVSFDFSDGTTIRMVKLLPLDHSRGKSGLNPQDKEC